MQSRWCTLFAAGLLLAGLPSLAADEPIKRIPLEKAEVAGTNLVVILSRTEIVPNGAVPRHTHPGLELTDCLEGEVTLSVEGQADRVIKAGDHFLNPAGVPHSGKAGPNGAVLISSYVVDKDKPLASPAP